MKNKKIVDIMEDQYFFVQYGKLMHGFIHNINGLLTSLDSKIQLHDMKLKLKIKKLEKNEHGLTQEAIDVLNQEYDELSVFFEEINNSKRRLNSLLSILNEKIVSENIFTKKQIDVNGAIKNFHEYFKFYKRYKHNTDVEFDLEGSPFINMEYRDFNFLLYAIVRNGVDAGYEEDLMQSYIKYTTKKNDDYIMLSIENKGSMPQNMGDFFKDTFTTKERFGDRNISIDTPLGYGTDLLFLGKIISKYSNIKYDYYPSENNEGLVFTFKFYKQKR